MCIFVLIPSADVVLGFRELILFVCAKCNPIVCADLGFQSNSVSMVIVFGHCDLVSCNIC